MELQHGIAVIQHAPGIVQVGTDWGRELLFTDLTPAHEQWLLALGKAASGSSFPYGNALPVPSPPPGSLALQVALRHAGYAQTLPTRGPRIVFHGVEAALCPAIDAAISTGMLGTLSIDDPRPYGRDLIEALGPQGIGTTRAAGVSSYFARLYPGLKHSSSKVSDLTVVTCARSLDHGVFGQLLGSEECHLCILMGERGVIVGPLVVPGHYACARCLALHMSGRDPALIAAELSAANLPLPRLSAVAQARLTLVLGQFFTDFLTMWRRREHPRGSRPPLANTALAVLADGSVISHTLSPHPECGCVDSAMVAPHMNAPCCLGLANNPEDITTERL